MSEKRELNFWMVVSLVVGNMIGSGIYLLPTTLASIGSISLFSFVTTGLGALFLALVFARLGTRYPYTGGPYHYCKRGFGNFIGYLVAYNYWVYLGIGCAGIATAFSGYFGTVIPSLNGNIQTTIVALILLWIIIGINIAGVFFAGALQLVMTVLKIVPLIVLTLYGAFFVDTDNLSHFNISGMSDFSAISRGSMLVLWGFLGLESACIPAGEVMHPEKTIPRATILGTLATAFIYLVATLVIMGVVPNSVLQASPAPFAHMATVLFGPTGQLLVAFGAMVSCIGTLNGWILSQSRIAYAASNDVLFPKIMGKLGRYDTPSKGLIMSGVFSSFLLLMTANEGVVDTFTRIITIATFCAIVSYLYTCIADILLQGKEGNTSYIHVVVALLAFIYVFWAIASIDIMVVYYGTLMMLFAVPLYAFITYLRRGDNGPQESI